MINYSRAPNIEKPQLSGFSLSEEFPEDKQVSLLWYDGPLESNWIRKDGTDYINTFFDTDDTRIDDARYRELVFKIEPQIFLDHQKGIYSFLDIVEMSDDYFIIEYQKSDVRIWSMTLKELEDLYDGNLPFGTATGNPHKYDDYFEDTMKPYLQSKIRNNKINSLKL